MSLHTASITDTWELEGEKEMPSGSWYFIGFLELRRSHRLCESQLKVCRDLPHIQVLFLF